MEHPADIRHRAGSIEGYVDFECAVECNNVNNSDLEWLKQTVIDLADEVERLRGSPARHAMNVAGLCPEHLEPKPCVVCSGGST